MSFNESFERESSSDIKHYGVKGMRWGYRTTKDGATNYHYSNPFKANKKVLRYVDALRVRSNMDKSAKDDNETEGLRRYADAVQNVARIRMNIKSSKKAGKKDEVKSLSNELKSLKKGYKENEKQFYENHGFGQRYTVKKVKYNKNKSYAPYDATDIIDKVKTRREIDYGYGKASEAADRFSERPFSTIKKFK